MSYATFFGFLGVSFDDAGTVYLIFGLIFLLFLLFRALSKQVAESRQSGSAAILSNRSQQSKPASFGTKLLLAILVLFLLGLWILD